LKKNKIFSVIGSILLFFIPTQHNHLHPNYYFIAEGLAIVAVMILISFAIWLMMIIFKKLMALIAAITLHELKTSYLDIYAWISCLMASVQYLIK